MRLHSRACTAAGTGGLLRAWKLASARRAALHDAVAQATQAQRDLTARRAATAPITARLSRERPSALLQAYLPQHLH